MEFTPDIDAMAPWARDTVSAVLALIPATDIGHINLVRLQAETRPCTLHVDGIQRVGALCTESGGSSECLRFKRYPNRYHCAITSRKACSVLFQFEEWARGEGYAWPLARLWWFDQRVEHGVVNGGNTDRVHLIMDAG